MKVKHSPKQINRSYHAKMKALVQGEREKDIFASLANGKNSYLRLDRLESSSFDKTWIDEIEGVIFDLGEIINNPRLSTLTEGNIVPVELARKTNADSVQHLASHTQYIKEIDDYGNVIPSKILGIFHDDDLHTYENRFIATFIRRLFLFVEKRYEYVSKIASLHNEEVLYFKNQSNVEGATVEIETKIKISTPNEDDEAARKTTSYIERIKQMREYILYFINSPFMRSLRTDRDVRNPILQTNIIRKNPKYHHCYEVYRFIETYDRLGVNYKVEENYSLFNDEELNEINRTLFANYITLKGKDKSFKRKVDTRVYKPKILTSLDDESYAHAPLFRGPVQFVRVDEEYQKYLDSLIKRDLPLHPTKKEKEYYADEYLAKQDHNDALKEKESLLKRVNKEEAKFDKYADSIVARRQEEADKLKALEKAVIKKEEEALLTDARKKITASSEIEKAAQEEKARLEKEQREAEEAARKAAIEQAMREAERERRALEYENRAPIYSSPVTFEEAVPIIWSQIPDLGPVLRELSEEEKEEQRLAEEKRLAEEEAAREAEAARIALINDPVHPILDPVTYPEAVKEVWPQLKDKPEVIYSTGEEEPLVILREPEKEEPVVEEPVIEEAPEVIEPSHPIEEPVTYPEAVKEVWPQLKDQPEVIYSTGEEEPLETISKPEENKEIKEKPARKKPAKKPAPKKAAPKKKVKEEPVQPAPAIEEPVVEEPVQPEPVIEEVKEEPIQPAPVIEEVKEEPAPVKEKPAKPKAPKKKPPVVNKPKAQSKKEPVKKAEKPKAPVKKEAPVREKIPGRYIVKLPDGYYVSNSKRSVYKEDAKIFDDFVLANDLKKKYGGKVVKL